MYGSCRNRLLLELVLKQLALLSIVFFIPSWNGSQRRTCDNISERCLPFDHLSWLKSERWLRDTSFETEAAFERCSLAAGHLRSWFPTWSLPVLWKWLSISSESPKRNTAANRLRLNNTSIKRCSVRASNEISVNNNNEPLKQRRTINHKLVPSVSPWTTIRVCTTNYWPFSPSNRPPDESHSWWQCCLIVSWD